MSEASKLLLQNLPAIQQIINGVCRRKGMDRDETEEFAAVVRLRLVENDYAIVRAYKGRSSFNTYIASVITRMVIDYRRQEWGKWRHSATAERLGGAAVEIERLVHRDGRSLSDALAIVGPHHPDLTPTDLRHIAEQLAPRPRRKMVALEEAAGVAIAPHCDDMEQRDTAAQISTLVKTFVAGLSDDDQLILKLRFDSDMSVTEISVALGIEYQGLWRRLQKLYRELRRHLERGGIAAADVENLVGTDVLLDFQLKNCEPVPSEPDESSVAARQEDMSS